MWIYVKRQQNDTMVYSEKACTCSLLATIGCSTLEKQGVSAIQEIIGSFRSHNCFEEKTLEFRFQGFLFLLQTDVRYYIITPMWKSPRIPTLGIGGVFLYYTFVMQLILNKMYNSL